MSDSAILWTTAGQAPLSMWILQARLQNGLPCLPPGNLANPGIKHRSLALQVDSSPSEPSGKPRKQTSGYQRRDGRVEGQISCVGLKDTLRASMACPFDASAFLYLGYHLETVQRDSSPT